MGTLTRTALALAIGIVAAGSPAAAQDHSQHTQTTPAPKAGAAPSGMEDSHSIF